MMITMVGAMVDDDDSDGAVQTLTNHPIGWMMLMMTMMMMMMMVMMMMMMINEEVEVYLSNAMTTASNCAFGPIVNRAQHAKR